MKLRDFSDESEESLPHPIYRIHFLRHTLAYNENPPSFEIGILSATSEYQKTIKTILNIESSHNPVSRMCHKGIIRLPHIYDNMYTIRKE